MMDLPLDGALAPPPPNLGGFESEDRTLHAILQRLVTALRPLRVVLFGSRAEGRARPDSDFDLLVVLDDDAPDERISHEAVYAPVLGMGIGCDVVPCRWSDFVGILDDPTDPWGSTFRRGKVLYER